MSGPSVCGRPGGGPGDEGCPAAAYLDVAGEIFLWSPQAEALLGYPAHEVCGTPALDLLAAPDDRDAAPPAVRDPAAGGGWDGTVDLRHRDGHRVRVSLRLRPMLRLEARAGWSVSVTDARYAEYEEVDHAILEALFSQSPIAMAVLDTDLRYVWVNAATERVTATPADRLIGRRIGEAAPEVDFETTERILRRVRDTGRPRVDFLVRGRVASDPDREHVWSGASFRLTDSAGRVLGMCQTYVDITEGHRAQRRLSLLTEAGTRIGTTLDAVRTAQGLADAAVPGLADVVAVDLLDATVRGEEPDPGAAAAQAVLRRSGARSVHRGTSDDGYAVLPAAPESPQAQCLVTGRSVLLHGARSDEWFVHPSPTAAGGRGSGPHSLMAVPLRARGITLGVAVFGRHGDPQPYDEGDLALAEDFCSRAAVSVDNARRYTREHVTALTLQRRLLPHDLPDHPAAEIAHRYLPAAAHAGAGGDWFDVIPLSGARVALVAGDVTGHGLHAAAVMGQLRTAVHTLADLGLDPDEVLTQLDDLVVRLTEEDPDCEGATCLYAVHDPVSRVCTWARAGHPPPAAVRPDGAVEFLDDVPPGPPLGLGGLPFETAERRLAEGTVLALYTDGLLQSPRWDIDAGLDRLARAVAGPHRPLEQVCESVVASLAGERRDDAVLLLARTRALAADQVVSWELPNDPALVAHARGLTQRQLAAWGLEPLSFATELIISELVTNAMRHARGPIALRLIQAGNLICEVSDGSLSAPHLRRARTGDEGGRGLFLVAQLSSRWGTRYGRDGKTIWAEQPLISGH